MASVNQAMIASAGFGARLAPITDVTPKALVEVGGLPMLDRLIYQLRDAGIERIIVNSHYKADLSKKLYY